MLPGFSVGAPTTPIRSGLTEEFTNLAPAARGPHDGGKTLALALSKGDRNRERSHVGSQWTSLFDDKLSPWRKLELHIHREVLPWWIERTKVIVDAL